MYIEIYFYIALTFNILNTKPRLNNLHFIHPNTNCMHIKFLKIALLLCLSTTLVYGQKKGVKNTDKKPGMLSFNINYSDYGFFKAMNDSSLSYAFSRKGLFKSGNSSFGFGASYWKGLGSHFDFSGNFIGTFSNFPALYVKGDSVGKALPESNAWPERTRNPTDL